MVVLRGGAGRGRGSEEEVGTGARWTFWQREVCSNKRSATSLAQAKQVTMLNRESTHTRITLALHLSLNPQCRTMCYINKRRNEAVQRGALTVFPTPLPFRFSRTRRASFICARCRLLLFSSRRLRAAAKHLQHSEPRPKLPVQPGSRPPQLRPGPGESKAESWGGSMQHYVALLTPPARLAREERRYVDSDSA